MSIVSIIIISIIIAVIVYIFRNRSFLYCYNAKSSRRSKDNFYSFRIKRFMGEYRCYLDRIPSFKGRDMKHYQPHLWEENGKYYICWTGKIQYPEQAKTLCRKWSDATQQFIDTGKPAPGFEKR